MRGKEIEFNSLESRNRITPAYAGKSLRGAVNVHSVWDHPRVCGEKPSDCSILPQKGGITPAHAGKSGICSDDLCVCMDHPRACGEK